MAKAGCSIADISAGMYAYTGILSALLLRDRTGQGSRVEISMLESLVEWMGFPMYYAFEGATPPQRTGASHATIYPYGPFPSGDGGTVMIGLQNEREWMQFCVTVLKRPELIDDERFITNFKRSDNRQALRAIIHEVFAQLDAATVIERLDAAQIANAQVNDMSGVWAHPQLKARGRWTEIASPVGILPTLLPPASSNAFSPRMAAVPGLGQHSNTLLAELGYSAMDIQRLSETGIVQNG
ncbi:Succinyl-CoA:(R)-benzylsuccinate CoA-transferase subunit BbsF [compost metagenome]